MWRGGPWTICRSGFMGAIVINGRWVVYGEWYGEAAMAVVEGRVDR